GTARIVHAGRSRTAPSTIDWTSNRFPEILPVMRPPALSASGIALVGVALAVNYVGQAPPSRFPLRTYTTWAWYGGSADQTRYSSPKQIHRSNCAQLPAAC